MICAIVLAAGQSKRMRVQKLLLPFGSKTVITHIVDQLTASSVDEVHVVVGCHGKRVSRELFERPVSIVNNSNYKSGMLSSVRCGLHAIAQQCRAVLVALGDQPSVTNKLSTKCCKILLLLKSKFSCLSIKANEVIPSCFQRPIAKRF